MKTLGKYRLIEPLASGGMAEVWRAEAAGPGGFAREVALKLVRGDRRADPEFARLFGREALLASRLVHPNIVQVFDHDEVEGRPYLAMELVRGRTLREVVDRCREAGLRLGLPRAVHVGVEVARALAYAHGLRAPGAPQGVVHRDVSPQNVLVGFEGEVKLADFGIARALDAGGLTSPGAVRGKAAYMAPEQARGEPVDGRADLFALAVVLWELCAGRRLFARDSEPATLQALLSGPPPSPPSEWNEEVPPELDQALLAALERDPERRTRSAAELEASLAAVRFRLVRAPEETDLRALMRQLWPGAAAPPAQAEPTRVHPAAGDAGPDEASTRTAPRGRWGRARPAAALLALAALAGGVAWWRSGEGEGRGGAAPAPAPGTAPAPAAGAGTAPAPASRSRNRDLDPDADPDLDADTDPDADRGPDPGPGRGPAPGVGGRRPRRHAGRGLGRAPHHRLDPPHRLPPAPPGGKRGGAPLGECCPLGANHRGRGRGGRHAPRAAAARRTLPGEGRAPGPRLGRGPARGPPRRAAELAAAPAPLAPHRPLRPPAPVP